MTAMNAKRRICTALLVLLTLPAAQGQVAAVPDTAAALRRPFGAEDAAAFVAPPRINYPQTWFHLIGGNVSAEGITEDFEAIARTGISGVQLFHGQFGGPWPGVDPQIPALSPGWDALVRHAAREGSAAGFALHDAELFGLGDLGRSVDRTVERHAASGMEPHGFVGGEGPVVLPRPVSDGEAWRDYRDIAVLAFPTPLDDTGERLRPVAVESRDDLPWREVIAGTNREPLRLPPCAAGDSVRLEITFPEAVVVRTVEPAEHEQHQPSPLLRAGDRADGGGRGAGRFAEAGAARRGSGEQLAGQHAGFVRLRRRLSRDPLPGGAFEPPSHDPRVAEILYRRAEELLGVGGGLDPPQSGPGERLPEAESRGVDRPRPYRGPDGQDAARRRAGVDASRRSLDRAAHRTCQYGSEKFARASRRHGLGVQQTRSRGGRGAVRRVYRPAARRTAVWRAAGRHTARQLGVRDADLDPGDGARVRPAERLCAAAVAAGRAGLCRGRSGGFGPLPARLARDDLGAFHGELLRHDGPPGPRERAVRHLRDGRRGRLPGRHPGIFQVRRRADVRVLAAVHRRVCGVAELQAGQADRLGGPALRQAARRGRGLHVVLPYVGRTLDDAQGDRQPPSVGRGDAFGLSYLYAQPAAALPAARHVVRRPGDRYALPARTDLVAPHARNQRLFRPVQLHAGAGMARVGRALVSGRRA